MIYFVFSGIDLRFPYFLVEDTDLEREEKIYFDTKISFCFTNYL